MTEAALLSARALQRRLNRVGWMLFARQFARALPHALIGASAGCVGATLLLVLLPATLFGSAIISAQDALAIFGAAGAALGFALRLRHARKPAARETALALESRIGTPTASLVTALEAGGDFAAPVLQRAARELDSALAARGPQLYSNRALLAAPAAVLVAALTLALAWGTATDLPGAGLSRASTSPGGGLAAVDAGSGSDVDDARALAQAMGLRKAAAALQAAAAALRQPDAAEPSVKEALGAARRAVADLPAALRPSAAVPDAPETSPEERARQATILEGAAGNLSRAADKAGAGAGNSGAGIGVDAPGAARGFVPFPAVAAESHPVVNSDNVTGQSPARRALVRRAMEAAR
jgi:hypothetical protein